MEGPDEYLTKILKIAEVKYNLDKEVVLSYSEDIQLYYDKCIGPIRAVDFIAKKIHG
jgi:hypothetical protein